MLGFGWCHLRSSRLPLVEATFANVESIDTEIDRADEELWQNFREWMKLSAGLFLQWQLFEALNNHQGLLTYCVSRNHRTSAVWEMLEWIATNGPGSYGLFYCHDDEDFMDLTGHDRKIPMDYDNVFRVHRLLNGELTETDDPFLGMIEGGIDPMHPYNSNEE